MIGKGRKIKSSNEKFIIGKGVDAGNLKGRVTSNKTAPMAAKSSWAESRRTKTAGSRPVRIISTSGSPILMFSSATRLPSPRFAERSAAAVVVLYAFRMFTTVVRFPL